MRSMLAERIWPDVEHKFMTDPLSAVTLDGFLAEPNVFREELLKSASWVRPERALNVRDTTPYERLGRVDSPIGQQITADLMNHLPIVLRGHRLVGSWAILAGKGPGLPPHADNADVVLNLWLTSDDCNLDKGTGGLILFDVERPAEMQYPDFVIPEKVEEAISASTKGVVRRVPYRFNRAILFVGRRFHATDSVHFHHDHGRARLNVTFAFAASGSPFN